MGVFDEYRTYVGSSTVSLVENTPDYTRQSILYSIMANRDIVPDLLDATLNCFAVKNVNRMFEYARDEYTNGLPEGSKGWAPAPNNVIESVLAKEYPSHTSAGRTFKVVNASLGTLSNTHICIERFAQDPRLLSWQYWNEPDQLGQISWSGTYNYAAGSIGPEFRLNQFRINSDSPIFIEGIRKDGSITAYYSWGYNDYHEPLVTAGTYYTVEYQIINQDGSIYVDSKWPRGLRYWSYYPKSLRYPELNLEEDSGSVPDGTFYFPVVPLRVNNVELQDKNTSLYSTSKKLLKFIELDIDELHEAVLANPDISAIDHAYIVFGIDVHTTTVSGVNYLYEYFDDEYTRQTVTKSTYYTWWYNSAYNHPPLNSVVITDGTYKNTLVFSFIDITEHTGVIGSIGYVDKSITIYAKDPITSRPPGLTAMQYEDHRNTLVMRKQVTANTYRRIEVAGLCSANNIHGSGKSWWTGLWGAINVNGTDQQNAPIIVPLNVAIVYSDLNRQQENSLYYEALKVVFNSFEIVKLKWYETSFFSFISQIVVLAISIFTGGLGSLITSLQVAIASGLISVAVFTAKLVLTSIVASSLFSFAAEELGIEFASIFSSIALLYGVVGTEGMFNLPFATDTLFIGTALAGAGKNYMQGVMVDIQESAVELQEYYEGKFEELDKINEELSSTYLLDPLRLYTSVGMLPGESPTDFLDRSLINNPGLYTISAVSNFVDNSLRLPQL